MADASIVSTANVAAPEGYTLQGTNELLLKAVRATIDGSGTATAYLPALQLLDPNGNVMWTAVGSTVAAGASADVSWFPDVGGGGSTNITVLHLLDLVDFNPVTGKVAVTSTNPDNPTTIVSSSSVTYDGLTQVKIDFYASAADIDQRGKTGLGGLLLELWLDTTPVGVVFDFGVDAGLYGVNSVYCSAIDTPSAGSHVYSIKGYTTVSGGTFGNANVYGANITTAHTTRPGFLAIFAAET
jgi:hypothetical protein